jgi:hypothetical protein
MRAPIDLLSFVLTTIAGWMRRHQEEVIAYLVEENHHVWQREYSGSCEAGLWRWRFPEFEHYDNEYRGHAS